MPRDVYLDVIGTSIQEFRLKFTRKPLFSQVIWKPSERPYKIREEIWSKSRTSTGPMEKAV